MIPISPAFLLRVGIVAVLLGVGFFGGCTVQKRLDSADIERKNTALSSASSALLSAKSAIEEINREADKRLAESKKQESEARAAEKLAREANEFSAKRADAFEKRLAKAGKSKPDCAQLLAMDLEAVCGVRSK